MPRSTCYGISIQILELLAESPLTLDEIAEKLGVKKSYLSAVLSYLEKKGYAERDELTGLLVITPKGEGLVLMCEEERRRAELVGDPRKIRVRTAEVREAIGRKNIKGKVYEYTYYTLPLNIYIPKEVVYRYGREYIVRFNTETGEMVAVPKKLAEERGELSGPQRSGESE